MTTLKTGDRVIKNHKTWQPNEFDLWGRGVGIGRVVDDKWGDIDVRWPGGRCYEDPAGLIKLPKELAYELFGFPLGLALALIGVILLFIGSALALPITCWSGVGAVIIGTLWVNIIRIVDGRRTQAAIKKESQ